MLLVAAILLAVFVVSAPWNIALVAGAAVIEIAEAVFWIWLSRRRRVQMGPETLVGATAQVVSACRPYGQVRIQGELWRAHCAEGADAGEQVTVRSLDGLTLVVERAT